MTNKKEKKEREYDPELNCMPLDKTKEFCTEDALKILDFFYKEAKKRLKLHDDIAIRARNEDLTTTLNFYTRDFAINLSCDEERVRKFYPCTERLIRRSRNSLKNRITI